MRPSTFIAELVSIVSACNKPWKLKFFSGNTALTKTIRDRCILTVGAPLQGCKIGNRGEKKNRG